MYSTAGLTQDEIAQGYRINEAGELVLVIETSSQNYVDDALQPSGNNYLPWLLLGIAAAMILKRK